MIQVNLLPKGRKEERLFPFFILLAFILGNLIFLMLIDASLRLEQTINGKEDQLNQLVQMEESLKQELIQAGKKVSLGGADPREVRALIEKVRLKVPAVMDELTASLPQGGSILSADYAYPGAIQLVISLSKPEDAALYLNRLRKLSFAGPGVLMQSLTRVEEAAAGGAPANQPPNQAGQAVAAKESYQAAYTVPINNPSGSKAPPVNGEKEKGGTNRGANQ